MAKTKESLYSKIKNGKITLETVAIKDLWDELKIANEKLEKLNSGKNPQLIINKIETIIKNYKEEL
ncbi:hypothetical protein HMPREF1074_00358 [Bacteroides xylanisolvens CL03T12C04]|uniref:Uncharacterized protein n=1 Tax=Bacteroides xylanisolvens CL03T12C04 TaxID=997892 RepID=I9JM77_9BACE|nr:hypothetical protein [Bacteroides xylanisolvens]EIY87969.1 hypothetical protein HMPREF1074_00358 [Bacteroides xylanisolvens CL03T12C04]MBT0706163.1 hypothetical protein [Bacteroides xylanisolvens CL03T12C04]